MATTAIPQPRISEAVPTSYRAAVVHDFDSPLSVEQVPMPRLDPGQVRVKVEACGLCHTDIHAANGDWPIKPSPPFIPGHEGVGIVTELAPGVSEVAVVMDVLEVTRRQRTAADRRALARRPFGRAGREIVINAMIFLTVADREQPSRLRSCSIRASDSAPMFTCIETPSAPIFRAFCTVLTSTFSFGSGASFVLADRCRIRPMSRPPCRWP